MVILFDNINKKSFNKTIGSPIINPNISFFRLTLIGSTCAVIKSSYIFIDTSVDIPSAFILIW